MPSIVWNLTQFGAVFAAFNYIVYKVNQYAMNNYINSLRNKIILGALVNGRFGWNRPVHNYCTCRYGRLKVMSQQEMESYKEKIKHMIAQHNSLLK